MNYQTRLVLPLLLLAAFVSSCTDPCLIPLEQAPRLRILNAMADQRFVNLYINNKLVQRALPYDPAVTYHPPTDPSYVGYITQFADSTLLPIGSNQRVVITSLDGDTLLTDRISLSDRRQTMIIIGRERQRFGQPPTPPDVIMLDDQSTSPVDNETVARYVHAMPDLMSLDIYFSKDITGRTPLRLSYGEVTPYRLIKDTLRESDGTYKRDQNGNFVFAPVDGLTVTEGGNPDNVIIKVEQPFELKGLLGTVVIRGATDAQGNEPIAAPVVLADGGQGTAIFDITSIFVRFINGTREEPLSLQPKGSIDTGPRNDMAGQDKVKCIPTGAISEYWSISPFFHGTADWHFGNSCPLVDINHAYKFRDTLQQLQRYTIAAMVTSKLNSLDTTYSHLRILDTMSSPIASTHGRVRFVNLSPDATVTIATPQGTRNLAQGEILYVDYPVGQQSFQSNGKTITFEAKADDPQSVWFNAATAGDPLPYLVSED